MPERAGCGAVEHPPIGARLFVCTLPEGHDGDHLDAKGMNHTWPKYVGVRRDDLDWALKFMAVDGAHTRSVKARLREALDG